MSHVCGNCKLLEHGICHKHNEVRDWSAPICSSYEYRPMDCTEESEYIRFRMGEKDAAPHVARTDKVEEARGEG